MPQATKVATSTPDLPLITVVMSAYNAKDTLRASVESILNQTWENFELHVVDDGSVDGSLKAIADVKDPRLHTRRQENAGKSVAINRTLDETRGEFFAVQDADDLSHPERLERQATALMENPDLAAVFSGHDLILEGRHIAPRTRALDREQCRAAIERMRMPAHDPTAMYRRSLLIGMRFQESLFIGQGFDFNLRVGEEHPMMVLGECLYSYRVSAGSRTRADVERRQRDVHEVCARACARRGIDESRAAEFYQPASALGRNRLRDNNLAAHFMESVVDQRRAGKLASAIRTGLACSALHPLDPHYHKALLFSLLPQGLVARLRGR